MKKIIKVSLTLILMLSLMFAVLQTASNAGYSDEMKTLIDKDYSDSTGTDAKVMKLQLLLLQV